MIENKNYHVMEMILMFDLRTLNETVKLLILQGSETQDIVTSFLFVVYVSSVISTLFIYCFIGECFIQESFVLFNQSTNFGNAIYNYDWYDLPEAHWKFFLICMIRTKKPQFLTSGKFAVLSLSIFTDILKTSMGYLSVLRTFL
ncbi:odorant receptor 22c-like [Vespula maculifrons]|uniref:Odorant receptor 22c-like n=1 Tax=Vespula maculifrons TaxID=7453 RepID=A0ABD2BPJ3_VESMC